MTTSPAHSPARTFFGTPCANGHQGLRYVSNGACVECAKQARREAAKRQRDALVASGKAPRKYHRAVLETRYAPEIGGRERRDEGNDERRDERRDEGNDGVKSVTPVKTASTYDPLEDL